MRYIYVEKEDMAGDRDINTGFRERRAARR